MSEITVPKPDLGYIGHVVPEGVVIMRHEDWLAVQDAVAIAKVSKRLTETQRARLARMQLISLDYAETPTET